MKIIVNRRGSAESNSRLLWRHRIIKKKIMASHDRSWPPQNCSEKIMAAYDESGSSRIARNQILSCHVAEELFPKR